MKTSLREEYKSDFTPRQYMISEEFEIYYYSNQKFMPSLDHSHTYYELYFFINGDIDFLINDCPYHLLPDDMVIIPPGVRHHAVARDNSKSYQRIVLWLHESFIKKLIEKSLDYNYAFKKAQDDKIYVYHNFSSIEEVLFDMIQENAQNRFGTTSRLMIVLEDLILSINRIIYEKDNQIKPKRSSDLFEDILDYIDSHITEQIRIEDLAREFYVSKAHISHIFKKNHEISVHKYITQKRLSLFREALAQKGEITPTYLNCGFNDYSSFFRAFKNEYGISPNDYKMELLRQNTDKKTE